MPHANPLAGRGILVTRPAAQAENLCRLIEAAGGHALRLPLLSIEAITDSATAAEALSHPELWNWILFTSANAVHCAAPWIRHWTSRPAVGAIGKATADKLGEQGIRVDLVPELEFNSESLLALPQMADLTGQKILIVRGQGGREHLATTLTARGGTVRHAEVYRRIKPHIEDRLWQQYWQDGHIHAVILTSGEAFDHLHAGLGNLTDEWARSIPLVVIGDRIRQMARERGWQRVLSAPSATDQALLEATITLFEPGLQGITPHII